MPELNTCFLERLKLHIECNISEENKDKYNIDVDNTDVNVLKKQIIIYYENQFKHFAFECNAQLRKAVTDINNFYEEYSYDIVRYVEEYITLNYAFKELVNVCILDEDLFKEKNKVLSSCNKLNKYFCDMLESYIYHIYSLLTTMIFNSESQMISKEEYQEYLNLPTFCIMVRQKLVDANIE